ncbi:MAG: HepT-like ribonuclease domain-containing protein, partial [Candidatus Freyarchaeota archaeon]
YAYNNKKSHRARQFILETPVELFCKVLSHSESLTAKKVIGFRNIIVHAYLDLNTNIVLNITQGEKNTATY